MIEPQLKRLEKLLVANRGEIAIRVLRAASELKIKTVAMYTFEDRYSLHRYKADESYQIGTDDEPLKPYLNIEEIIALAKRNNVDAIHPGYGFLSENVEFARRCKEEGIIFVGPDPEVMQNLGDKVTAKTIAVKANVPVIPDSEEKLNSFEITLKEARRIGFPVMIKASSGGGGRGMRVVKEEGALERSYNEAKNEALKSFGDDTVFLEKFIEEPKHIEVQIMADNHGNIVHLFERDCSVQRRFQKVVEIAPSILNEETKQKIYNYALEITRSVSYNNVGTVEFLVDKKENIYFIEVNPRIQVEHTITEEITGIDIVRSQILIAKGHHLSDPVIFINKQEDVKSNGFAIQCRITTEDPGNGFKPDYGTIIAYRNAGGFGIRLDEGSSYPGVKIPPFFDSMLVKISAKGRTLKGASQRLHRALREFRIRGVKTNIRFLENVISNPIFQKGQATVKFIEEHPELFDFKKEADSGTKTLAFLAEVSVNGNPEVKVPIKDIKFRTPVIPAFDKHGPYPEGTKDKLNKLGREGFIQWVKETKQIQYTDTTFRDAHQSLLATRVRTIDMMKVAEGFAKNHPQVFSMEVWGGATFDVSMRFLHECPWQRLRTLREAIPNILLQMLFRGSNGVGYTAYPNNLIEKFIEKAWESGIDIFRIFDSLNWVDAMKASIRAVRERTGAIAEAAICYTGEIQDPKNKKYTLQYYTDLAKKLEDEGAHMLCIKDMAGLLKPYAAEQLITALKSSLSIPIHLHTHDTSSIQPATYLKAIEAGVDIVDVALGSMSGLTSQPNFNSMVAAMHYHDRGLDFDLNSLNQYSNYWEDVREYYYPFESGLKAGTAEVYDHEIPGGQYSNLRPQAESLGLGDKFELVKKNYVEVNKMFGDIVKVTPSSKVVGDMAIFMTSANLTPEDIYERGETISFPESVIGFFKGELGQPYQGFPEKLQKIILRNEKPFASSPNDYMQPVDFDKELAEFKQKFEHGDFEDFLSYKLYPKVFENYYKHRQDFGNVEYIPTPAFFYGLKNNEEILIQIGKGKTIIVKLLFVGDADENGFRLVSFLLNGQNRRLNIKDKKLNIVKSSNAKVSTDKHIGAGLQGKLGQILVKEGEEVKENQPLFLIEAMKMESTITATKPGKVKKIYLKVGSMVEQDDMVIEME